VQPDFTLTERELMRKGAAGTLGAVFDRHAPGLRKWVLEETRDDEVAGDIVAETFAAAWRRRRWVRISPDGSAYPWLLGIAQSLVDGWRTTGRIETRSRVRNRMRLRAYPKPAPPATGLEDIRADLVDGISATLQRRPRVWASHAATIAMVAVVAFTHWHGLQLLGG